MTTKICSKTPLEIEAWMVRDLLRIRMALLRTVGHHPRQRNLHLFQIVDATRGRHSATLHGRLLCNIDQTF